MSVLTFCNVFSCTLLTSKNIISLAIWCNKQLKILQRLQIAFAIKICAILLSLEKLSFFLPNCTWNPFITYTYAVRFEKSCSDWWTRDCVVTLYNQPVLSNQNTVPFIFKKGFTRKKFLLLPLPPLHVTLKPTLSNLVTHVFLKYTKVVFSFYQFLKIFPSFLLAVKIILGSGVMSLNQKAL